MIRFGLKVEETKRDYKSGRKSFQNFDRTSLTVCASLLRTLYVNSRYFAAFYVDMLL